MFVAIALVVVWQVSASLSPMNGPFDAALPLLTAIYASTAALSPALITSAIFITFSTILTAIVLVQIRSRLIWKIGLQELERYSDFSEDDKTDDFPQQGVEVTSLPFLHQLTPQFELGGLKHGVVNKCPYLFAHFAALHNVIKTATFEVEIGSSISIRFWVPKKNRHPLDELEILCSSLQTSHRNIEFKRVPITVVPQILGNSHLEARILGEYIRLGNNFFSVIHLKGIPGPTFGGTQIDKLIHTLTERGIEGTFVVNFSSTKTQQKERLKSDRVSRWGFESEWKQSQELDEKGLGYWVVSAYMVIRSTDENTHISRVNSAKTILETTFLNTDNPLKTKILKGNVLRRALRQILQRKSVGKTETLSSRDLSILVHLPQQAQPGYLRRFTAEFELPPRKQSEITLFNAMKGKRVLYPVGINLEHLTTHMTVAGQTGKGKTRFVANLINQIQQHPRVGITIFDWKGEYSEIMDTTYRIGSKECPLKINLFEVHGTANIDEYVRNILALLRELLRSNTENDISPQMERIFRESLTEYLKRGNGDYGEYERYLSRWIRKHGKNYSRPEASVAGLINRFGSLFRGRLGWIFDTGSTTLDFETLIQSQVCFDLSELIAYSKDDARLFVNILLMVIRTYLFKTFSERLRYLVIAEEAQYLVPEIFSKRSTADASPAEDITLFQRAYGAGLITVTTRPNLISRNILANSGIKVFFQCPLDSNVVGDILNLNPEQRQFLTLMPERIVIAHLPWFEHPFKATTQEFHFPTKSEPSTASDPPLSIAPQSPGLIETYRRKEYGQYSQPVTRHFLNLACTALFEQDILHRITRFHKHTVIDIPRYRVLLIFLNKSDGLDEIPLQNLEEIASEIVIVCPPRHKSALKATLTHFNGRTDAEGSKLRTYIVTLTFSEMQKLAKYIKENRLYAIEREASDYIESVSIGQIVKSWRRIERVFKEALRRRGIQSSYTGQPKYTTLLRTLGLDRWKSEFEWLRRTRNQVLHEGGFLTHSFVQDYCKRAENLLTLISQSIEQQSISNPLFR